MATQFIGGNPVRNFFESINSKRKIILCFPDMEIHVVVWQNLDEDGKTELGYSAVRFKNYKACLAFSSVPNYSRSDTFDNFVHEAEIEAKTLNIKLNIIKA